MNRSLLILLGGLLASAAWAEADDAGAPVRSLKRGVCANQLSVEDARALSAGVTWYYNWHFQPERPLPGVDLAFYPMVWGDAPEYFTGFTNALAGGPPPPCVLVLNEPNLRGQAFLPPERAAALYQRVKAVTDARGIRLIGPHMALGSSTEASITAFDPIQQQDVTYTYMVPYLDAFYHFLGGTGPGAIAVHSYGKLDELKWLIGMLEKTYPGREIWVTEFAWWDAANEQEEMEYLTAAVDLFERTPSVAKYAWFMARLSKEKRMSLLTDTPGELTELGKLYLRLPVHAATPDRNDT